MVDLVAIEHIIDSMEEAVDKLEKATSKKDTVGANKLRTFIFDLSTQIDKMTRI